VFQSAQLKLQHRLSLADHTRRSRDLIERMRLPLLCSFGATDDLKVTKLQAMANLEKHTSGWLQANPTFFPNRMNDAAFQIAFSCRHILHLVNTRCNRRVLDRFGQHLYHCDKRFSAPLRNKFHAFLKISVADTLAAPMRAAGLAVHAREPHMSAHFDPAPASHTHQSQSQDPEDYSYRRHVGIRFEQGLPTSTLHPRGGSGISGAEKSEGIRKTVEHGCGKGQAHLLCDRVVRLPRTRGTRPL
jgi:hypothetical protein